MAGSTGDDKWSRAGGPPSLTLSLWHSPFRPLEEKVAADTGSEGKWPSLQTPVVRCVPL